MTIRVKTRQIKIGGLKIGGDAPIAIQSMCNTRTENVKETVAQILALEDAGCDIVRVAVPNMQAVGVLGAIKKKIHIPLVADVHFDFRLAIEAIKQGVDKVRINPGNIGGEDRVAEILKLAKKSGTALRLGVNAGSLEKALWEKYGRPSAEAMTESALNWIKFFEKNRFYNFAISVKSSDVIECVRAYEILASKCDYPLHVGITEAGLPPYSIVKTAIGIGSLLLKGIGDTIRASICADPATQVRVCKDILKALHLYKKEPEIICCPTCGRTEIDLKKLAGEIEKRLVGFKKPLKISIMGCVVNGPGEAQEADFGIAGGKKMGAIFRKGKIIKWVAEEKLVDEFIEIINKSS